MSRILIEDQTLIDRLVINDTDAFEELYLRYWSGLYLYCVKKLQSPYRCQDYSSRYIYSDLGKKK